MHRHAHILLPLSATEHAHYLPLWREDNKSISKSRVSLLESAEVHVCARLCGRGGARLGQRCFLIHLVKPFKCVRLKCEASDATKAFLYGAVVGMEQVLLWQLI